MSAIHSEPVVGWRLWKVRDDELCSWAVEHGWQPGDNAAVCLADRPYRCPQAPGMSCRCGFWALYSPVGAMRLASATPTAGAAIGLIAGFGTVAVHGREGFRAEMARVTCLFTDEIALAPIDRIWRRLLHRFHRGCDAGLHRRIPSRTGALNRVASRYAVPLVSLQAAVAVGVLGELGVRPDAIAELEAWLKAARSRSRRGRAEFA